MNHSTYRKMSKMSNKFSWLNLDQKHIDSRIPMRPTYVGIIHANMHIAQSFLPAFSVGDFSFQSSCIRLDSAEKYLNFHAGRYFTADGNFKADIALPIMKICVPSSIMQSCANARNSCRSMFQQSSKNSILVDVSSERNFWSRRPPASKIYSYFRIAVRFSVMIYWQKK